MKLKIYLISQDVNNDYDTYSDAVVIAKNEEEAKKIHPDGTEYDDMKKRFGKFKWDDWTDKLEKIQVEYLGEAKKGSEKGVVCASYHAG